MKSLFFPVLALAALFTVNAGASETSKTIAIAQPMQIPAATLQPGNYRFSVEDRLQDRAIVRITNIADSSSHLVLAVPNDAVKAARSGQIVMFSQQPIARAWACTGCSAPLEFVYPKAEAAKITGETAQSVLAVDPSYDKLPANLTADDMKVVTLWLLKPERITADNKGEGVTGGKWADARPATTELASVREPRRHLPKTASDTDEWTAMGILFLCAGFVLQRSRKAAKARISSR